MWYNIPQINRNKEMITIASGKFSNPRGTKQEAKKAKASAGSTAQSKQEKAKKGSKNRKIAIISICSAVLVVLIGIIVGVYFYANADEFSYQSISLALPFFYIDCS